MRIVLPTYRSIGWIVQAYAHLHAKYWGAPVTLLAEEDYSYGRFEFVHPPDEVASPYKGEIPSGKFSDVLIWYLEQIEEMHVLIMLADYLIERPVDVERLAQLEEYMEDHAPILRGQVGDDGGYCSGTRTDVYKDIAIWEGGFLPTSLTPGLWNRLQFLEIVPHGVDAWGVEMRGRDRFCQGGYRSIAPAPGILSYLNAIRGRDMTQVVLRESVYHEVSSFLRVHPGTFVPERGADEPGAH